MAAVAAMAVQRSWLRINFMYAELQAAINAMNDVKLEKAAFIAGLVATDSAPKALL